MNRGEACQQRIRSGITHLRRHRITHRRARLRHDIRQHVVVRVIRNNLNTGRLGINRARITVGIRLKRRGALQVTGEILRNHQRKIVGALLHAVDGLLAGRNLTPIKRAGVQEILLHFGTGIHLLTGRIRRALILNHEGTHDAVHVAVGVPVAVQVQGAVQQGDAGHRNEHQNRQNTAGQALKLNKSNTQNSHSYSFSAVFWVLGF